MKIKTSDLKFHDDLTPPRDEELVSRMKAALEGALPLYYASIPFALVKPTSFSYLEQLMKHHAGKAAIEATRLRWQAGDCARMWVYQRDKEFIMSDDYVVYAAAHLGEPEYVPCWVLGPCSHPNVSDVQGPIDPKEIANLMGFSQ